jgi:hypothetical protein
MNIDNNIFYQEAQSLSNPLIVEDTDNRKASTDL